MHIHLYRWFKFGGLFQAYSTFTLTTTVGYIYIHNHIDNHKKQDNMLEMYQSYIGNYDEK